MSWSSTSKGAGMEDDKSSSTSSSTLPLEKRLVDFKTESGLSSKISGIHKKWAEGEEDTKWIEFWMPSLSSDDNLNSSEVKTWCTYMEEVLIPDLKWLLSLPYHRFWSVLVHVKPLGSDVLRSFRVRAPRFYDRGYEGLQGHPQLWRIYKHVFVLVFRVYMRLALYKESGENYMSPEYWSDLLHEHDLLTMRTLMDLAALYENKENVVFQKMVGNLLQHDTRGRLREELQKYVGLLRKKSSEISSEVDRLIGKYSMNKATSWRVEEFEELLAFQLDTTFSLYKLVKVAPGLAREFLKNSGTVNGFAVSYEITTRQWGKVVAHIPALQGRVDLWRVGMLRLFRVVVAQPTLLSVESANDKRLDEFFDLFSGCIDEVVFIHDYEKAYPFRQDMQTLLSRGVFVEETRMEYMANAISSCFHACGEEYAVERLVVDPLYDPNFDRQLLGACSLDVTGVELDSLITQVNDLLPELPKSYVEAVLKHYGYSSERTINALLEGSVPSRLDKYKNDDYVKSQSSGGSPPDDPVRDTLPTPLHIVETESSLPKFLPNRKQGRDGEGKGEMEKFLESDKEAVKSAALSALQTFVEAAKGGNGPQRQRGTEEEENIRNYYVDSELLPKIAADTSGDYDDEYDDTYDDLGAGMTEPDNDDVINPLNRKKGEIMLGRVQEEGEEEEEEGEGGEERRRKTFDEFCEDPAIVRERNERRRREMQSRRGGGGGGYQQQQSYHHHQGPSGERDVVGRAKGQGQEKDVLYNRRQKTANKGGGGSWKKRSDFKRKEF